MKPSTALQAKRVTITCPNPRCKREHALFWYVGKNGRQLSYRCDHVEHTSKAKYTGSPIIVTITAVRVAPPDVVPADGLPEEWSSTVSQAAQEKAQTQLPM